MCVWVRACVCGKRVAYHARLTPRVVQLHDSSNQTAVVECLLTQLSLFPQQQPVQTGFPSICLIAGVVSLQIATWLWPPRFVR